MTEKVNISLQMPGGKPRGIFDPTHRNILSLSHLRMKVATLGWENFQKEAFIKYASTYPEGSLDYLWKNMNHFLNISLKKFGKPQVNPPASPEVKEIKPVREHFVAAPRPSLDLELLNPPETLCDDDNRIEPIPGTGVQDHEGDGKPGGDQQILLHEVS